MLKAKIGYILLLGVLSVSIYYVTENNAINERDAIIATLKHGYTLSNYDPNDWTKNTYLNSNGEILNAIEYARIAIQ